MENALRSLYNGTSLPAIGYGTGVVRRYTRKPKLFLKDNIKPAIVSIKHMKLTKKLMIDYRSPRIIKQAVDLGYRLFDSGRIYGYSECVIGKTLKSYNREAVYLSSKVSNMDIDRKYSPNDVRGNLENSLKYLQTDYLDSYLLHWPSGNWIDIYIQMEKLYKEGKVKAIGVCNFHLEHFEELMKYASVKPMICQLECHPLNTRPEITSYCNNNNILVMAHTPTGRMCEKIRHNNVLIEMTQKYKKNIAQIIVRWHYQNEVIPIIATTSKEHLIENKNVFDFEISRADMKDIDSLNENYIMLPGNGIDDPNYIYNL